MSELLGIEKFTVLILSESGLLTADGITYQGQLWIVPQWRTFDNGTVQPELMIRFDSLEHQNRGVDHDYTVSDLIPKSVLDGEQSSGFEVLSEPHTPLCTLKAKLVH